MRTVNTTAGRTFYFDSAFYSSNYILNSVQFAASAADAAAKDAAAANPATSAQTPIALGGLGRVLFSSTGLSTDLNLINQGNSASSITMRYRVAGSGAAWSTMAGSFVKGTASTGFGVDSFSLANTNLTALANNPSYEVDYEIYDAGSNLLRIASSRLIKDASGNMTMQDALGNATSVNFTGLSLTKVRLGNQPANTAYIDLATRAAGTNGNYIPMLRLYPNNLGKFDFNIAGLSGSQEIDIRAYNSNGDFINHNQATFTFDLAHNAVSVSAVSTLPVPHVIVIKPPQTDGSTINPASTSVTGAVTSALAAANPAAIGSRLLMVIFAPLPGCNFFATLRTMLSSMFLTPTISQISESCAVT
ncbi:MAG: hypothetical protein ABL859_05915, partial [Methylotenera sp.]